MEVICGNAMEKLGAGIRVRLEEVDEDLKVVFDIR